MADQKTPQVPAPATNQPDMQAPVPPRDPAMAPFKDPFTDGSGGWPIPVMTAGMTFRDIGSTGLRQFGGWVREEFLPQLIGRQAARTYREMLDNSSVVGSITYAITSAMRKVEWRTQPANDTPEASELADFAEECRLDMSHTWEDKIVEALSMLGYGFAPHEIVYKRRLGMNPGPEPERPGKNLPQSRYNDGRIGWKRQPLRGQDTIIKWFFSENGQVKGLTQQPWMGPLIDLPIEKLLLYRPSSHKNNPEGRSILRTAYRAYYFTKRLEEQEAILFERLSGLPVVTCPNVVLQQAAAGDPVATAVVAQLKKIATNVRIDEQMGILLPSDRWPGQNGPSSEPMYKFELITPTAGRNNVDSDKALSRYHVNILTSVLADFLQLGHEARGTQSLAVSKVDMFFQAIEGYLNSIAAVDNRYGIPRLWQLNGLDLDLMPEFVPDLAQRVDLDVLSNFILRLSQSGMPLFPDLDLENYLRDTGGLPDVADEAAHQALISAEQDAAQPGGGEGDATETDPATGEPISAQKRLLLGIVKGSIVRRLRKLEGHTSIVTKRRRPRGIVRRIAA